MKNIIVKLALLVSALLTGSFAYAQAAADAGLINQLGGDVTYQPTGSAAAKAALFIKVRVGDRFIVPAGAAVRIVYFESGRQESWAGPARFTIGQRESVAAAGSVQVSQVPTVAAQKLTLTPDMITIAKSGRTGSVVVRGLVPQAVTDARATYAGMRSTSPADDLTPELYFVTVLNEHALFEEMKSVMRNFLDKNPNSVEGKALAAWVNAQGSTAAK